MYFFALLLLISCTQKSGIFDGPTLISMQNSCCLNICNAPFSRIFFCLPASPASSSGPLRLPPLFFRTSLKPQSTRIVMKRNIRLYDWSFFFLRWPSCLEFSGDKNLLYRISCCIQQAHVLTYETKCEYKRRCKTSDESKCIGRRYYVP